ncbi:MAG: hypothetical protein US35_C0020G0002 [Parcubacteria group bacterium GW2011_GWA2_37_10]|nr:MAG: hypothetical protein US35_C0020G0002 [Parcubacteria group bacterium GW2011_GWA2_37_10]
MDGTNRANIKISGEVDVVLKADQPTGKLTRGKVKDILTSDSQHRRGVKVGFKTAKLGGCKKFTQYF